MVGRSLTRPVAKVACALALLAAVLVAPSRVAAWTVTEPRTVETSAPHASAGVAPGDASRRAVPERHRDPVTPQPSTMPGTTGELANALTALLLSGLVCAGVLTGAADRTRRSPTLRRAAVTADSAAATRAYRRDRARQRTQPKTGSDRRWTSSRIAATFNRTVQGGAANPAVRQPRE